MHPRSRRWRLRFNEAPVNSPGKGDAQANCHAATVSFNEAPVNSPGKAARRPQTACGRDRFNEAPVNSPGKGSQLTTQLDRMLSASMRPR